MTGDDTPQGEQVRELFRSSEGRNQRLFVPFAVTLELIWVLASTYAAPKAAIILALQHLFGLPYLRFEHEGRVRELSATAAHIPLDLGDLLVAFSAKENGCTTTLTFDRKAARSPLFTEL